MPDTEKIKDIMNVAKMNRMPLNKNFNSGYLETHAMFDGPSALADKIIDGMWNMCKFGVNNGVGDVEREVDALSDIVVALPSVGNGDIAKLTKHEEKADRLLARVLVPRKRTVDVTVPLRGCLSSCSDSADKLLTMRNSGMGLTNINDRQFALIEESKAIFAEIEEAVDGVLDTSSTDAQGYADKVADKLGAWRENCVSGMLTGGSISNLRAALNDINEWGKLAEEVAGRRRAKGVAEYLENDDLASVANGAQAVETYNTFMDRMESEKADIENLKAQIKEIKAERAKDINDINSQIDECNAAIKTALEAAQNGADVYDCNRRIKDNRARIEDLKYELGALAETPDGSEFIEGSVEVREHVFKEMTVVCNMLKGIKTDPGFLAEAINGSDFNSFIQILSGRGGKTTQSEALESIRRIKANLEVRIEDWQKNVAMLKNNRIAIGRVDKQMLTDKDKVRAAGNALRGDKEELDPELVAILNAAKTGEKQEQAEKKKIMFSEDDI